MVCHVCLQFVSNHLHHATKNRCSAIVTRLWVSIHIGHICRTFCFIPSIFRTNHMHLFKPFRSEQNLLGDWRTWLLRFDALMQTESFLLKPNSPSVRPGNLSGELGLETLIVHASRKFAWEPRSGTEPATWESNSRTIIPAKRELQSWHF